MKLAMSTKTSMEYYLHQTFFELEEWIDVALEIQKEEKEG
jgi:hypothetical protein